MTVGLLDSVTVPEAIVTLGALESVIIPEDTATILVTVVDSWTEGMPTNETLMALEGITVGLLDSVTVADDTATVPSPIDIFWRKTPPP